MTYRIHIEAKAIKVLEKIHDPDYSAIKSAIQKLSFTPRPSGYLKLKGRSGYRIRVGNYRIIYKIEDKILLVEVISVGHRKDIYD